MEKITIRDIYKINNYLSYDSSHQIKITGLNYNCIYSNMKIKHWKYRILYSMNNLCRYYVDFAVRVSDLKHIYLEGFVQFISRMCVSTLFRAAEISLLAGNEHRGIVLRR